MQQTWRWFGPHDLASVDDIIQTGVEGFVSALHLRNVRREGCHMRDSFHEAEHLGGDADCHMNLTKPDHAPADTGDLQVGQRPFT